jgi:hypothetical protein
VLILVKHLLAAASVASVFPFNFSQDLGRKNATTEVHEQLVSMISTIFLSLTCQSLSLSLLLLQSTKRSAFSLRFHEHMMTILSMTSKLSKRR